VTYPKYRKVGRSFSSPAFKEQDYFVFQHSISSTLQWNTMKIFEDYHITDRHLGIPLVFWYINYNELGPLNPNL